MSKGLFIDKGHEPTTRQILEAVGTKHPDGEALCGYLSEDLRASTELKFYGKNFGRTLRFRKGGRALAKRVSKVCAKLFASHTLNWTLANDSSEHIIRSKRSTYGKPAR